MQKRNDFYIFHFQVIFWYESKESKFQIKTSNNVETSFLNKLVLFSDLTTLNSSDS